MAQETAGTIGIPVLKNELLPYLTDYAKRSERAELYKQKAEQRAAELAAKKAAEDAKFVPEFEAGLGSDMWEHVDKAKNEADIQRGLALAKDPSVPRQQVALASKEINRGVSQRSNISKQLKETTLKTAEDLKKKGWNVGPEYAYQWARQQQDYKSPQEFAAAVRSNPDLIDFDTIGKKGKEYRKSIYSIETPDGRSTKQVEMSPLFEYKWEKDPFTGGEVPVVTGVNGVEAQKLIDSDPDIREAYDVFVRNKGEKYKNQTFIDPNTKSPIMLRPEVAELKAAEEFMENAFGRYGKVKYGQSFQMLRKRDSGDTTSDQYTVDITTKAGPGKHRFNVESLQVGKKPKPQAQYGTVGSKDDVKFVYSTEYSHPGNKEVRILQADEGDVSAYADRLPDGGYLLKSGFKYSSPTKRTLYFADKDLYFGGTEEGPYAGKNWTRIKKGDEVPTETALERIRTAKKENKPAGLVQQTGYELTANLGNGTSLNIFVPKESAGEIDKHIQMEQQKKRRKKGPETEVSQLGSGEVELIK